LAPFAKTERFTTSDRERVLQAMAELCAERGYRETTVEALTERAGVSRASFESMFRGGLEECLLAAVNAIMGETISVVSGAYSADRSEWDSAIAGIGAILELMAANPSYASLGYIVGRQEGPPAVKQVYESGVNLLVVMLDRLREYGEWEAQPPNAARAALGGAEALIRREIVAGRLEQLPNHLPDIVYTATVPFLGQEEALLLARRARDAMKSAWRYDGS
jgi:AcrR family transcriptional regulator